MRAPSRIARWLGAGPADSPRAVEVRRGRAVEWRALRCVTGSPLRVRDDRDDGDVGRLLLACARAGVPVELHDGDGAADVTLRLAPVSTDEALAWVWGSR